MFDLQKAIYSWRKELEESESLDSQQTCEMQNHLLDEIQSLIATGLSQEEAFFVAKSRLGSTGQITTEFAKVNGSLIWQRRIFWMLTGVFMFIVASAIGSVAGKLSTCLAVWGGLTGYGAGVVDSLTHIFVLIAVMFVICKVFSLGKTGRLLCNSRIATIGLLVSGVGVVLLRMGTYVAVPAFSVRILSLEEYGRIMLASQVGMLVWAVLGPIILAVILIRFGRSNRKIFA